MSAVALAVPGSLSLPAGAFSWPPEDPYWPARKPVGGFALLTVDQLCLPWHAYQHGLLTAVGLRGYLASREMPDRRCELEPGTRVHYRARELQEFLGPAVRRSQATAVLEALEASGLVAWTEPAIRMMTQPTDLQGLDPSAYAAMRAHVHPLLYRVRCRGACCATWRGRARQGSSPRRWAWCCSACATTGKINSVDLAARSPWPGSPTALASVRAPPIAAWPPSQRWAGWPQFHRPRSSGVQTAPGGS